MTLAEKVAAVYPRDDAAWAVGASVAEDVGVPVAPGDDRADECIKVGTVAGLAYAMAVQENPYAGDVAHSNTAARAAVAAHGLLKERDAVRERAAT